MGGALPGEDGRLRCPWALSAPEYVTYHDEEWGRPVTDDDRVYQKLCLEGFQAGLSWLTILRKREGFREAFSSFDPTVVAAFGDEDIERLLGDTRIVRNRAKIAATITNARATLRLGEEGISLAGLIWRHARARDPAPATSDEVPPTSAESRALSSELRRRGFTFVGPTTVYAAMQSLGAVNDHLRDCYVRATVESERRPVLREVW